MFYVAIVLIGCVRVLFLLLHEAEPGDGQALVWAILAILIGLFGLLTKALTFFFA